MIDGIKLTYTITDVNQWRQRMIEKGISFHTPIDTSTGEIKAKMTCGENGTILHETIKHNGEWRGYKLNLKEIKRNCLHVDFYLIIEGSLHKSYFNGSNYQPFGYAELCTEIKIICDTLELVPEYTRITNIEFGVNIVINQSPFHFLKNHLISYKGEMFNEYEKNRKGICLGYYSQLTEYSLKIYDKGLQYDLKEHLMRFELRFTKLRELRNKAGIISLYDLLRPEIYPVLNGLLLAAWDNVLLVERAITKDNLSRVQRTILDNADNPKYWMQLKESGGRKYDRYIREYRELAYTRTDSMHKHIKKLIQHKCRELAPAVTVIKKPVLYHSPH